MKTKKIITTISAMCMFLSLFLIIISFFIPTFAVKIDNEIEKVYLFDYLNIESYALASSSFFIVLCQIGMIISLAFSSYILCTNNNNNKKSILFHFLSISFTLVIVLYTIRRYEYFYENSSYIVKIEAGIVLVVSCIFLEIFSLVLSAFITPRLENEPETLEINEINLLKEAKEFYNKKIISDKEYEIKKLLILEAFLNRKNIGKNERDLLLWKDAQNEKLINEKDFKKIKNKYDI